MKYKVGDRVLTNENSVYYERMYNKTATIIYIDSVNNRYLLEFDEDVDGHSGLGGFEGKDNHCWYVWEDDFELIERTHLKFAIGDVVKICCTEGRPSYKTMVGKVGTIVDANYERLVDDERITYRVRVDNNPNEYQEKGLWVFHEEKSLKLYNAQNDDQLEARAYILAGTRYSMIELDDIIKGETNNMNNIVEIYKDRKYTKIDKKYKDLRESVKNADPRYKIFKECVDTLDKLYKEDKVVTPCYTDIQLSEETTKKLIQLDECRREECEKLHKFVYEVTAQLQMCETYDQKMNILKTYKIIKENGRVNA